MIDERIYQQLLDYVLHLDTPRENTHRLNSCRPYFEAVNSSDIISLVDDVMDRESDIERVKILVTRMLHSFSKAINRVKRDFPRTFAPIEELLGKNDRLNAYLAQCSALLKEANSSTLSEEIRDKLTRQVISINDSITHYTEKEYRLFPLVEKFIPEHRCVGLMWAIHDDIRKTLSTLISYGEDGKTSLAEYNRLFGTLFFDVKSMIMREEQILFPEVIRRVPANAILTMNDEQFESGRASFESESEGEMRVDLLTGNPTLKQIVSIFNNLPVDITFIDSNDEVVFFSTPEHRVFHRSKGIVGRNVKNCHPPRSLHVVERIISAFKDGSRDTADFFLILEGRKIRIEYRAVRDGNGTYLGTLEVTQDVTDLTGLNEPKRLLDWE